MSGGGKCIISRLSTIYSLSYSVLIVYSARGLLGTSAYGRFVIPADARTILTFHGTGIEYLVIMVLPIEVYNNWVFEKKIKTLL